LIALSHLFQPVIFLPFLVGSQWFSSIFHPFVIHFSSIFSIFFHQFFIHFSSIVPPIALLSHHYLIGNPKKNHNFSPGFHDLSPQRFLLGAPWVTWVTSASRVLRCWMQRSVPPGLGETSPKWWFNHGKW
jgi:hypothetical protein